MFPRALLAATLLLGGCATPASAPSATVEGLAAPSAEPQPAKRFDDLDIALELDSTTVAAGAELEGEVVVENRSGHKVVDPGCWLAASGSAVVPPDDPEAELWLQVVVDCAGPNTIHPGDEQRDAITFIAATKYGDPLPPGDYVAAVEYRGLSRRLEVPIEVTG
jgi:hypothetical protein